MQVAEIFSKYHKFIFGVISFLLILVLIDKVLAIGIAFLAFLAAITFLLLKAMGFEGKTIYILFWAALLLHAAMVAFMHLTGFQPFSGGDYVLYDEIARIISDRLHQGNFYAGGTELGSWYPVIIGYIYALLGPNMFFGQMLNAWATAVTTIIVYLIVLQIGRSEKEGFLTGMIATFYPSFIFFGSSMLKDALVVLLSMLGLLLTIKLIKKFSWLKLTIFYILLIVLTNFRIYVGLALILSFIICWFLFSGFEIKKRIIFGILLLFLLGSAPAITGYGYFGRNIIVELLNPAKIIFYREIVYAPPLQEQSTGSRSSGAKGEDKLIDNSMRGAGSSFVIETGFENPFTFVVNSCLSFIYVVFGPFPWNLKHLRQIFVMPEMIAWYFLIFFIVKGIVLNIKKQYKIILPLIIFSILVFGVQALYSSNFGIIVRIRMPAFLSLLCLFPLGFTKLNNIKIPWITDV